MTDRQGKGGFRSDINGLRAWAVIAVVIYHLPMIDLSGGFVGVDIFFVISGFLMTSIVLGGIEKGSFSILKFYMSRIRRILPALIFVVMVLLIFGWYYLSTVDYQSLSNEVIPTLQFFSNIYYWDHAGYFDSSKHGKWLLHTWSLSVEAQFYLLYPIFIILIKSLFKETGTLWIILFLSFLASLLLNLVVVHIYPIPTFFLLPTRAWELLAGGLVYLTPIIWPQIIALRKHKTILPLGWLLLISSILFISDDLLWPGYWAIAPVLGTAIVLFAQNQGSILTNNRVCQWIGERSYSLYLWHWPAIILLYFMSLESNIYAVLLALVFSVIMSHLSFHLIETSTNKLLSSRTLKFEAATIFPIIILVMGSAFYISNTFFSQRIDSAIENIAFQATNVNKQECEVIPSFNSEQPGCIYGNKNKIGAILIGDSHSSAVVTALAQVAKEIDLGVLHHYRNGCATLMDVKFTDWMRVFPSDSCAKFIEWVNVEIEKYPANVPLVIVSRFDVLHATEKDYDKPRFYFSTQYEDNTDPLYIKEVEQAFVKTACEFGAKRPLYVVQPIPIQRVEVAKEVSRDLLFYNKRQKSYVRTIVDYKHKNKVQLDSLNIAQQQCDMAVLDPTPYLCKDGICPGMIDGMPIFSDDDHLNENGNKLLTPLFEKIFE